MPKTKGGPRDGNFKDRETPKKATRAFQDAPQGKKGARIVTTGE